MAFKNFPANSILTSSDVNTFLMKQSVITCTSTTRPASPVEGMTIYETDTDIYQTWTGSAWSNMQNFIGATWTAFTPTIQNFTLGNGSLECRYFRVQRFVHVQLQVKWGSTTSLTGNFQVVYPLWPAHTPTVAAYPNGVLRCFDDSLSKQAHGFTLAANGVVTTAVFETDGTRISANNVTATSPFTWATDDLLLMSFTFEDI